MKIFCLILALYALLLSADVICLSAEDHSKTCNEQECRSDNKNGSSNACDDCCSPFVVCGNCSTFSFPLNLFSMNEPSAGIVQQMPLHHFFLYSEFSSSIWQPPKIS